MARIPIKGGNQPATHISYSDGQKIVETGGGTNGGRVDVYENGRGKPDGPGKDHYWATFDRKGNMTTSGGERRSH